MSRRLYETVAAILVLLALGWAAGAAPLPGPDDYEPGVLIVRWTAALTANARTQAARRLGVQATAGDEALRSAWLRREGLVETARIDVLRAVRVRLPEPERVADVCARLLPDDLVAGVEPNYRIHALAPLPSGPNDPRYQAGQQWWVEAVGADRVVADNLLPAGAPVTIAIIDTGIWLTHEDLAARLVPGLDVLIAGGNANDTSYIGHGTHAAGIAAALTNNALGIAGTASASQIRLMPVRVLDDAGGGYDFDAAQGIVWAVANGAKVLNLSFGGTVASSLLEHAVNQARQQGCVVVAAAGNEALAGNPRVYPAAFASVLAVAACNSSGARAAYSSYHDYVDLAAPGGEGPLPAGEILSTYNDSNSSYEYLFGTSMAAPVVAGAAAMLWAQTPSFTADEVEARLIATADKISSLAGDPDGWNPELGWGRVNIYGALTNASTYVSKPSGRPSYPFPNPFCPRCGERTRILIPLAAGEAAGEAVLKITDAWGRPVATVSLPAGEIVPGQTLSWDGRNGEGQAVANGVYPYRLTVNGNSYTNKIVVVNQ